MTHTSVWVKIPKLCHKKTPIYLFLGKGRESFVSDFIKTKTSCAFCPALQHTKYFSSSGTVWMTHAKNSHKIHFLQISHLSSNRRVCNLTLYFQFTTPTRELTNSMNFSNAIILRYLEPAKCQKSNQKTQISYQTALIDPSHNAKESISFS